MKRSFLVLCVLGLVITPAGWAAEPFTETPQCVTLVNTTEVGVLGHVETAMYTDDTGRNHWYRKNFKLEPGAQEEACSTGPFFSGGQLRVVLKSLFPLYTCKVTPPLVVTILRGDNPETGPNGLRLDCPAERAAN